MRVEGSDQHEAVLEVLGDPLTVRFQSLNAELAEVPGRVGEQGDGVEDVVDDERAEHVQLKVPAHSTNVDGHIIPHHLRAHHRQRLALGRVHLAGHDGASGLVLRQHQLAEATPRPTSQPPEIVGNLVQRGSQRLEGAMKGDQGVTPTKGLEFVVGRDKGKGGEGGNHCRAPHRVFLVRVEAGAHSGATKGELVHMAKRLSDVLEAMVKLGHIARELLSKGERGGILQMSPSDLHNPRVGYMRANEERTKERETQFE